VNRVLLGQICAVLTALSWAIAVVCYRKVRHEVSSLSLNIFKTTFALLLFLITFLFLDLPLTPNHLSQMDLLILAVSGFFGITLADWTYLAGLKRLGAQFSAIVSTSYSPIAIGLAFFLFSERIGVIGSFGAGLVILGITLGYLQNRLRIPNQRDLWSGVFYGLATEVMMVSAVLSIRDILRAGPLMWIITFRFLVGAVLSFPFLFSKKALINLKESTFHKSNFFWMSLGSFFGPYLATIFWLAGFQLAPATKVAVLNQLSTVFIFILSGIFLKEPLSFFRILAMALAVIGALLVQI